MPPVVHEVGARSGGVELEAKVVEAVPKNVLDHRTRLGGSIGRSELDVGPNFRARMDVGVSTRSHDGAQGEVGAKPQVARGPDHEECAVVRQPFLVGTFEHEATTP